MNTSESSEIKLPQGPNERVPRTGEVEMSNKLRLRIELGRVMRMLKSPKFYLLCMVFSSSFAVLFSYCTVIVDFSIDIGVKRHLVKYVLQAASFAEFAGKLGLGWVTDKGFVSRRTYFLMALALMTVCAACLPLATNLGWLVTHAVIFGVSLSGFTTMLAILTADYLDRDSHSISFALISSSAFPMPFVLPAVIGHFRDNLGSYDGVFYVSASLLAVTLILWLLEPFCTGGSCPQALRWGHR